MASVMIRVGLTQTEWRKLRKLSLERGVPLTRLVADAIRESLLNNKGAKP